jgi:hypothetical protein
VHTIREAFVSDCFYCFRCVAYGGDGAHFAGRNEGHAADPKCERESSRWLTREPGSVALTGGACAGLIHGQPALDC